ncbi:hypothetical protein D7Z54_30930 [Salibacterium salarium]|uniref:Uncharacterized protein n=1 Tax=Salibacterium salarium TaxID=284579 RepID=A0A428MTM0_9BACI|nr:hypothetical protein [Salibacterium salarium]RSL29489.1 hypothetical protein D7Z54_30930 [Salibacterium salarium]
MNPMHMHNLCKQHVGHLVMVQMSNNEQLQGFIEDVDENNVYMMVPENANNHNNNNNNGMVQGAQANNMMAQGQQQNNNKCGCHSGMGNRQFFGGGYGGYGGYDGYGGYGSYGGYPGGGYGGYGPRPRYRRLILPLTALAAISTLF